MPQVKSAWHRPAFFELFTPVAGINIFVRIAACVRGTLLTTTAVGIVATSFGVCMVCVCVCVCVRVRLRGAI